MSSSSGSDRPVKVAFAQNLAEGEMIQGLLSEQGIPSMLRQPGLGTPYNVAAGARDVLVPEEVAERAREVLAGTPGAS